MISGAHAIIYSQDATADRAFFRDVLGLPNVDVGQGWGRVVRLTLPGGGAIGVYQPKHARPESP